MLTLSLVLRRFLGMLEFIQADPLAKILEENNNDLQAFLRKHNRDESADYQIAPAVMDTYIKSCGAFDKTLEAKGKEGAEAPARKRRILVGKTRKAHNTRRATQRDSIPCRPAHDPALISAAPPPSPLSAQRHAHRLAHRLCPSHTPQLGSA